MRSQTTFDRLGGFLAGLAAGAAVMYLLDPDRGARRRSLVRDRADHFRRTGTDRVLKTGRHLGNRSRGVAARLGRREGGPIDAERLEARVRAAMGHAISNPSAISVSAHERTVTLAGPVLSDEMDDLVRAVSRVPGVGEVRNLLQIHDRPPSGPALDRSGS